MKTISKITLAFAFFAAANSVFASGNLKVNIHPVSNEKAVVEISSLPVSKYKITVVDDQNQIVYKEMADPNENYRKVYDFADLENGRYKLIVVCDNLTTERKFWKFRDGIKVGNEKNTMKPFFGYQDGILRCTYLNFPKDKLTLYLFEDSRLLYSKEIGHDFNVTEALNLSKLDDGNYEALLSAGTEEYSFQIEKK